MIELLQIGYVLHFGPIVRGSRLRSNRLWLIQLVLQPPMRIKKLATFVVAQLHLFLSQYVLQIQYPPQFLEIPYRFGFLFVLLYIVPPELILGGFVVVRVDSQHWKFHIAVINPALSYEVTMQNLQLFWCASQRTESSAVVAFLLQVEAFQLLIS